jgi:hypothetical protein
VLDRRSHNTTDPLSRRPALRPAAPLVFYCPFKEGGNARFHARLRAEDPACGVREVDELSALAAAGFGGPQVAQMPAHNRLVSYRRS